MRIDELASDFFPTALEFLEQLFIRRTRYPAFLEFLGGFYAKLEIENYERCIGCCDAGKLDAFDVAKIVRQGNFEQVHLLRDDVGFVANGPGEEVPRLKLWSADFAEIVSAEYFASGALHVVPQCCFGRK